MNKYKIIIADDHEVVVDGLKKMLEDIPFLEVVETISEVKKLIPIIKLKKVNLLILDLNMQDQNTLNFIAEIKNICQNLRIIAFTSYDTAGLRKEAAQKGVDAFLTKNVSKNILLNTIRKLLLGEKAKESSSKNERLAKFQDKFSSQQLLSERETEILKLVAQGNTSQQIAEILFISKHTVQWHRKNIIAKLGLKHANEMIKFAYEHNLF